MPACMSRRLVEVRKGQVPVLCPCSELLLTAHPLLVCSVWDDRAEPGVHFCSLPLEITPQINSYHNQEFLSYMELKKFKIPRGVKTDHVYFKLRLTTCSLCYGGDHPLCEITSALLMSCHTHIRNKKISI